ncbi:carboxylesterase family protein [Streptomyces sp. NPDC085639]|uniref:carboxylesterase family protein n=1 Tax=Streptomyces sp. NPDC085639 TaxID=3365734 RepID=UPI0037D6C534
MIEWFAARAEPGDPRNAGVVRSDPPEAPPGLRERVLAGRSVTMEVRGGDGPGVWGAAPRDGRMLVTRKSLTWEYAELRRLDATMAAAGGLAVAVALRWVRDNIAAFGGDPDHITLAGRSGGVLSVAVAEKRAARGRPVRAYQYDLPTPAHGGQLGAAHCLELPFVFNDFDKWSQAPFLAGLNPRIRDGLAGAVPASWISFIRTGDPHHGPMPNWARYARGSRSTMSLDAVTGSVDDLAGYWRRLHRPAAR